jgi:4-hydroxy-4-methyl-2-oxoglutarate aldolase
MGAGDEVRRGELQALGTALVCDVLDTHGHRNTFLGPSIRAVWPCGTVAGIALTIDCEPTDAVAVEPYGVLFDALATRHDDSILVISAGDQISGLWGELLSVAARARGVVGVVMDGLTRDVSGIASLQFPVFARGTSPLDSAGRQDFAEVGVPVTIGTAVVRPGDWIVADDLGAVVVPVEHVDAVIDLGIEKMHGESTVKSELQAGDDLGEVFRRHGIL